ncbi:MAG: amylo-alpha-1,6-glucosidase, partial [Vicinamibacterales bacterium]
AVREWLVTNGLGGYASGTVAGVVTRKYHGLLVAALPAPVGRIVMLSHLDVRLHLASGRTLDVESGAPLPHLSAGGGADRMTLAGFELELGLPVWRYTHDGTAIEKRVIMSHGQNTTHVAFTVVEAAAPARLELRPFLCIRHYESPLEDRELEPYAFTALDGRFEVAPPDDLPVLRLLVHGQDATLVHEIASAPNAYGEEESRGYPHRSHLWSPGYFQFELRPGDSAAGTATLVASTESWEVVEALSPAAAARSERSRRQGLLDQAPDIARAGVPGELVLAADQFLITPVARPEDTARAAALGLEARSVIAGYHWFTDWGRDTMIALEGLTLTTGRALEAKHILRTFASYARDGLIPNMFPDGEREALYHTADATLWFFHAVGRYLNATGDQETLQALLPTLHAMVDRHVDGTRFGIGVDPADGLLRQGEAGYQLTWMDAKVEGWVVTPRRGKAVEINALFYNALRLLEHWSVERQETVRARSLGALADRLRASFNRRFWYDAGGYLYDVVDGERGDDGSCRPNQVLAISLDYPVLDQTRWAAVLATVQAELLTPFGLRTLAPGHPDYRPRYYGDLRARDAAYHQGTVWPWLLGPYVDAWIRVHPDEVGSVRTLLETFGGHLSEAGVGSVSEIFDGERPFTPRGCIAQAWSVAEVLRASVRLLGQQ